MESDIKKCTKCGLIKSLSEFHKRSSSKVGYKPRCKTCRKEEYKLNSESIKKRMSDNYQVNRDSKIKYARQYYRENRDKCIKSTSAYKTNKRRTDPVFNLKCNIARRLRLNLSQTKVYTKKSMMYDITGMEGKDLINHLYATFEENYGLPRDCIDLKQVEIDHIIPISTAKTVEDVERLNHYINLQLLFKEDNQAKGTKITP